MQKREIIDAIEKRITGAKAPYSKWYIGVTNDLERRKEEHKKDGKNVKHWKDWKADDEKDARDIEQFYINKKKMKGGTGGGEKPTYVYIF